MNKLIREIYNNRMQNAEYNKIDEEIELEIQRMLEYEERQMQPQEYEQYRDKLYQAAFAAKENGFIEGFQYAVRLLAECFIQKDDFSKS